jgi:hypothetical protein
MSISNNQCHCDNQCHCEEGAFPDEAISWQRGDCRAHNERSLAVTLGREDCFAAARNDTAKWEIASPETN